jgi:hypothetical protein
VQLGGADLVVLVIFVVFHGFSFCGKGPKPHGFLFGCLQNFSVNPIANLGWHPAIFLFAAQVCAGHMAERIAIAFCANSNDAPCVAHVDNDFVNNLLCVHFVSPV